MASLSTLHPSLQPWANWIFRYGKSYSGKLVVTSARRSAADQARLRAKYLAGKSQIYAAPVGRSAHQTGWAFDIAQVGVNPIGDLLLHGLGAWWNYYGGRWGGPADPVHFGVR